VLRNFFLLLCFVCWDDAAEATLDEKIEEDQDEEESQDEEEPEGYMLNEFGEENKYHHFLFFFDKKSKWR
jgi:hypothetical protein